MNSLPVLQHPPLGMSHGTPLQFQHCQVALKPGVVPKGGRPKPSDLSIHPDGGLPLDHVPTLISPSQLDQFLACERKWGFQYLDGRKAPTTKAQELGSEMHGQLEDWLTAATPPASDLLMTSGALAHFPAPRSKGLSVEGVFVFRVRRAGGEWIYFWGFMDVMVTTLTEVQVYDLKTTSDLCWAKTTKSLIGQAVYDAAGPEAGEIIDQQVQIARADGKLLDEDTQGAVYAISGMLASTRCQALLKWVYVQTRGAKKSQPVTLEMTWDAAVEAFAPKFAAAERVLGHLAVFESRDARAKKIIEKKTPLTVHKLQATPSSCGAYGGCPFLSDCVDVSESSKIASRFAQDKLKADFKSPTGEKMAQTDNAVLGKLDKLMAGKKPGGGIPIQQVGAAMVAVTATGAAMVASTAGAVTSTAAQTETAAQPEGVATLRARLVAASGEAVDINGWPGQVMEAGGKWVCTANGETYKHLSKDEVIKLARAVTLQAPPPPPVEKPKAVRAPRKAPAAAAVSGTASLDAGFILFLDVLPTKGPALQDVDTLLAPLRESIEEQTGVASYRLIEYNQGQTLLAAELAAVLEKDRPTGLFQGCSKTLDKGVLEVLVRYAETVFKGVIW